MEPPQAIVCPQPSSARGDLSLLPTHSTAKNTIHVDDLVRFFPLLYFSGLLTAVHSAEQELCIEPTVRAEDSRIQGSAHRRGAE